MKRARFIVYMPGDNVARFSDRDAALSFGRFLTGALGTLYGCGPGYTIEVSEPLGLIGQFINGRATPEFAHLD